MTLCRHCNKRKANRPGLLCWACYYTPGVREQHGVFASKCVGSVTTTTPEDTNMAKAKRPYRNVGCGYKFRFKEQPHPGHKGLNTTDVFVKWDGEFCRRYYHPEGPLLTCPPDIDTENLDIELEDCFFTHTDAEGRVKHSVGPCSREGAIHAAATYYKGTLGGGTLDDEDLIDLDNDGEYGLPDGGTLWVINPTPYQRPDPRRPERA